MTYVLVDDSGLIVNRIALDDVSQYVPEDGLTVVAEPDDQPFEIGGTLIDGVYTAPELPPPLSTGAPALE